jgi:hypothetical protein
LNRPPNILLVVLDCVAGRDFRPTQAAPGSQGSFYQHFLPQAACYTRAVAPSPWTIPSHASLLTGLEPWEHGAHAKGTIPLQASVRTLTDELGSLGYRTGLFSANPILDQRSGLNRGFAIQRVAAWWEHFLRGRPTRPPSQRSGNPGSLGEFPEEGSMQGAILPRLLSEVASHFPFTVDLANRLGRSVSAPGGEGARPSPWVEPSFRAFLRSTPRDQAVFALVNFCDAHEPYITSPSTGLSAIEWWRTMRIPQQLSWMLLGKWHDSAEERERLHALYLEAILRLQSRLSSLVDSLIEDGRWEDTLMVVTSDHGQNFLGPPPLFHRFSMDESVLRIPLFVRDPRNPVRSVHSSSWVSLAALHDAVASYARQEGGNGLFRLEPPQTEDLGAVFSVADGFLSPRRAAKWLASDAVAALDRVVVVAHSGLSRLVFKPNGHGIASGAGRGGLDDAVAIDTSSVPGAELIRRKAESIASLVSRRDEGAVKHCDVEVSERLESWGYV